MEVPHGALCGGMLSQAATIALNKRKGVMWLSHSMA